MLDSNSRVYLYQKVYISIREQIFNGTYKPDDLLPTEHSIGEIYKVDRTTVRKALQLLVDDGLVEKKAGKGTIVRGSSQQEPVASNLMSQDTIAFFLSRSNHNNDRITQPFYATLFYTIETLCRKNGYKLIYTTINTVEDFQYEARAHVYAAYIFVSNISTKVLDLALEQGVPSIIVNNYYEKITSILSDNFDGTYKACKYLIGQGHTDIGIVEGLADYSTTKERLRGCLIALQEHGLTLKTDNIMHAEWDYESAYNVVKNLIKSGKKLPTALVAFNDHMAVGAIRAANEMGLRVPEDISIMGFDNLEQSEYLSPQLSTIDIGTSQIGEITVYYLLEQMRQKLAYPVKILAPVKLVIRGSVMKYESKNN